MKNILSDIISANMFNTDKKKKHEVLTWYDVFTKQNYFSSKEEIIFENKDLVMGAPSYAILLVFLQYLDSHHVTTRVYKTSYCRLFPLHR